MIWGFYLRKEQSTLENDSGAKLPTSHFSCKEVDIREPSSFPHAALERRVKHQCATMMSVIQKNPKRVFSQEAQLRASGKKDTTWSSHSQHAYQPFSPLNELESFLGPAVSELRMHLAEDV